jgi:glycosyltransferase involved in cell wall biosynthesis
LLPSISIVIPTLNVERVIEQCLSAIYAQDYPKNRIEIIIVDAGSTDRTIEIARKYRVHKIINNPLKTGEAGKSIGIDSSQNELIALIDSDNIMDGNLWLRQMVEPFSDEEVFASEVLFWTYRREDTFIDRYCALTGINDPFCLFLGNYDRYSYLTGKWTNFPCVQVDKGSYLKVTLDKNYVPTMGANGFLIRKAILKHIDYHPYYFDIDVIYQLVQLGFNTIARPKIGIIHLFCNSIGKFRMKQRRRIADYFYFQKENIRTYKYKLNSFRFIKGIVYILLTFPLILQAIIGYQKKPDIAWFFHPIACWITLWEYSFGTLRGTFKAKILDREGWKQ